nr:transmembrane protein 130 isoform X5 [Misgurnus anguillicaudatus]
MDMNMFLHYRIRSVLDYTFLSLFLPVVLGIPDNLIHSSGNVPGKITFHQMKGNYTYLRDSGDLATYVPTLVTFELSDPRHHLQSVAFTYTWGLGNGQVYEGPDPFVQCRYTTPGNYTFKLSIEANTTKQSGLYSIDLTVLDAIQSIELRGPLNYNVDKSSSLFFHVGGSPPVWICWRVLSDCHSSSPASCNLIRIYKNVFNLTYTFTSVGAYCLEVNVTNDISNLQTSYNIYVQNSLCCPLQESHLTCKTLEENTNDVSFTDVEMHGKDTNVSLKNNCLFSISTQKNEAQPLLDQQNTSYNT